MKKASVFIASVIALSNPAYSNETVNIIPVLSCEAVLNIHLVNAEVVSAKATAATEESPSICLVEIAETGADRKKVTMWYGLPITGWNGRFMGTGGGAYAAGVPQSLPVYAAQGYVTGATDAGKAARGREAAMDGSFALNARGRLDWPAIRNFGHVSIHRMTVTGKLLTQDFYGEKTKYSYFNGCSTGGRQGLMEAQRYPADYDGILSGAPAIQLSRFHVAMVWPQVIMSHHKNLMPQCKITYASQAAIESCDPLDGVTDGIISDPENCHFDAQSLIDSNEKTCGIFSEKDAAVMNDIWQGPRRADGSFLWYGYRQGTMLGAVAGTKGDPLVGAPNPIAMDWLRYFLLQAPEWTGADLNRSLFEQLFDQSVEQYTHVIGTENPDLSPYRKNGGKLIMWHGESDQLIPPEGSSHYYKNVQKTMGTTATDDFMRLYMAPGVGHCAGGAGPQPTGQIEALIAWVEQGKAPEDMTSEKRDLNGGMIMSRPLCAYPKKAVYDGKGSTDDAASFSCNLE